MHTNCIILGDPGADSGDEGKSKWAEKCGAKKRRRKVKNGEKSPSGQCLTRPVPNGRRRSGFWLVPENLCLSGTIWHPGALLVVLYFSSFHIYFSARLDLPSSPLSAPGSPRMAHLGRSSWKRTREVRNVSCFLFNLVPRALFPGFGGATSTAREKRPGDEVVLCCKTLHVHFSLSLNPVANLNPKTKYTNQLRKTEQFSNFWSHTSEERKREFNLISLVWFFFFIIFMFFSDKY